jgi:2-oxoglutarate dehydrogenase E1 component
VYYDLLAAREARKSAEVALVRVEQLYPFVTSQASEILAAYPKTAEIVWAQEEPRNMGPWHFVRDSLREASGRDVRYVGRPESASPATGSGKRHQQEQTAIVDEAFAPASKKPRKKK